MKHNGIVFTGGAAPPPDISRGICRKAASEGKITIVAADSGLIAAEKAGIIPDVIAGDMDSLDDLARLDRYPVQKVRRFPPDKDLLDTEIALNILWEAGSTNLVLIGGGGGRLDHLLALRALFDRPRCPNRWVSDTEDIQMIESGAADTVNLHVPAGTRISVLPVGPSPWSAASTGLTWPLTGLQIEPGWSGISNTAAAENISITASEGRFLVFCPLLDKALD
jgi:thiamine pyrophosphokinase